MDNVGFFFVFLFVKAVRVQSVVQVFDSCVIVLCGVVGILGDDGVCEGRFSVN